MNTRIAIIGAGIAGLAAAHELKRAGLSHRYSSKKNPIPEEE